ncbi:hypothetical protein F7Q99_39065 [Streptomyces kaniharaensis]|uniref:Uncharacterized protein n=1 Tax=Streptomyces kaniharaensis TaxID=212423 RepID=A0A6N7L667_9ACTN|nr:hypothetical protein [Streptomyces kaniharaensis]
MTPESPTCPRCLGLLAQFDGDVGALSRVAPARRITICGVCGADESVKAAHGLTLAPPEDWPVPVESLVVWPTGVPST